MEWDKWMDLLQVALMAKHSISVNEVTREETLNQLRDKSLLGNMEWDTANEKVVSLLFFSLKNAPRKTFRYKFPTETLWSMRAKEVIEKREQCFPVKRNRTLDLHLFLSRKQKARESSTVLECAKRIGRKMRTGRNYTNSCT